MEIGNIAPDFVLKGINKNGEIKEFKLYDYKEKKVIIFLYLKDDKPVCTIEANDFNNNLNNIETNAIIFGISADNSENHQKFKQKYGLDVTLLSDTTGEVLKLYDVLNENLPDKIMAKRTTFLIGKDGSIKKIWKDVAVDGHVEEVLKELKKL